MCAGPGTLKKRGRTFFKHKIGFELAERALGDPQCISVPDPFRDEQRWRTLGSPTADGIVVLYVVHTWPEEEFDAGRIISARRATIQERRDYEER